MRRLPPRGVSRGIPPRCGVISRSFASAPNRPGASGASGASRLGIGFFLGVTAGASAAYTYARRTLVKEDDAQSDVVTERATVVEDDSVEGDHDPQRPLRVAGSAIVGDASSVPQRAGKKSSNRL